MPGQVLEEGLQADRDQGDATDDLKPAPEPGAERYARGRADETQTKRRESNECKRDDRRHGQEGQCHAGRERVDACRNREEKDGS